MLCICTTLFCVTNVGAQKTELNQEKFRIPNTKMEVTITGKTYQVLNNGVKREFKQKKKIRFRNLTFDPLLIFPKEFIPLHLQHSYSESSLKNKQNKENAYIIQFKTQAFEGYQKEIIKIGGKIYTPLHDHSLIVILSEIEKKEVGNLPFVRWIGNYHPSFKLEHSLKNELLLKQSKKIRYSILLLDKLLQQYLVSYIIEIGGEIELKTTSNRFEANLSGTQLLAVANRKEVLFIDKWTPMSDDMDVVKSSQGINYIERVANYTGQGVNAEVCDNGVLNFHIDFRANSPLIHGENDETNDHGTSVYGIVFGSGRSNGALRGILPDAKTPIFSSRYHIIDRNEHTAELVDPSGPYRAVFQTNSWGSSLTEEYTTITAELDQIAFDNDLLILQSQSNEGTQMSRPQAWAKNVVSVGGIRHYNTATRSDDVWGGESGASIGPASDGRIKPDLSNFFDLIRTTSNEGSYTEFSGTSGATPITAGHFGLLFQMWAEGVFDGDTTLHRNVFDSRPHMSTAKALMINMAYQYEFSGSNHDKARVHQGWGFADVKNIYHKAKENNWSLGLVIDESDIILPLEEKIYEVNVDGESPLKITLVYADPSGSPGSDKQLINDLSLKVISPNGEVYWGNNGLYEGNWSTPDGESNHLDNVENVFIQNPDVGNWQIKVIAEEIIKDSHIETVEIDADYALVVTGNERSDNIGYVNLTTTFTEGDSIHLDPPGGKYLEGESVILTPLAKEGHKFLGWKGDTQGNSNPLTVVMDSNMSISAKFIEIDPHFGESIKLSKITTTANRRAMPFFVPREGKVTSVSIYHNGGDKTMILGVYDGTAETPSNLLSATEITDVSPNNGWQTIDLITPVNVADSQQVWLAWVFESNPGIYYASGTPGRVDSDNSWNNKMPELWGDSAKPSDYVYSIFANLLPTDTLVSKITCPSTVLVSDTFQLNSDGSQDPAHEIISYKWDFGDGTISDIPKPLHIYALANTYSISLKITNSQGHTHVSTKEISVVAPDQLPIAEANGPYSGIVNSIINFSKLGSLDPDGYLTDYTWSFGDGNNSSISNPSYSYTEAGEFIATLIVTDQLGNLAVDTAYVSITDLIISDDLFEASDNELLIYPNPVKSSRIKLTFQTDYQSTERRIRLMNMQGLLIKEEVTKENEFLLDLEGLPNGMYLIVVQSKEKLMGSKILLLR